MWLREIYKMTMGRENWLNVTLNLETLPCFIYIGPKFIYNKLKFINNELQHGFNSRLNFIIRERINAPIVQRGENMGLGMSLVSFSQNSITIIDIPFMILVTLVCFVT